MQLQPLHGLPSEDQARASSRHASCSTGGCCRSDDMIDVIIFWMILLMLTVTVNRQRQKRQRLQRHHQVLTYQIIIKLTKNPAAPAPEAPAVIVNVVAAPPQVGDRDRRT